MTIELDVLLPFIPSVPGLDAALRPALAPYFYGLSTFGTAARPVSLKFRDDTPQSVLDSAPAIVQAHDPVFLTADKLTVQADGVDIATIAVATPKTGAAPVTLQCKKPDGTTLTQAVTLAGGLGTVQFRTVMPGDYVFTVLNPGTRTTDQLTIKGV